MGAKNTKPDVKDRLKGSLKKVWPRYPRTVGDPDPISRGSSGSQEVPPTYCQEMYESNERQHDIRCQDVHSKLDSKRYRDKPQLTQGELNDRRHDAVPHTKPNGEQHDQSRRQNQPMDNFSIQSETAPPAKLDLWQRAFYNLTQDKQQLIKSIPMPIYDKLEYDDVNINPDTASRLKALSGVVKAVKIQYEIDQKESRIKEPAQKIVKAVISFQEFIQAAVAFDPTGHATSVWAVVSLGLNVCSSFAPQLSHQRSHN